MSKPKKENLELANTLMKRPTKDKKINTPVFDPSIAPGAIHQADLLFLPHDKGYKYALVVVDIGSRLCDAEPLKTKKSVDILKAFKLIYGRNYLTTPTYKLEVDDGKEFKSVVKKYFEGQNIVVRVGKPGRHRQQAIVERYNAMIGRAIFEVLHALEIETKETQTQWVDSLPEIVDVINKGAIKRVSKTKKKLDPTPGRCSGQGCELLNEGDMVYVISDEPRDITGIKLHGKHRIYDLRWEPTPRTIVQVIIRPYQPPLYRVEGIPKIAFTRNQLRLLTK